jgi:tripartite-type tricarboxylate transporter receptor subunit TctC
MEQIASNLKGQALHVPYAGFGQCLNDMAGGVVDVSLMPIAGPIPGFVDKGAIRAIAVFNDKPSPRLPNVPLANATKGFENYNHVLWSALHVSNKVPDAVVAKLHAAIQAALSKPELRKAIEAPGATVFDPMSPQQAHAFFLKDAENMEKMAKMVGVTKK